MTIDLIAFYILAAIAVAAALGMLLSRNAVYSALFLILNFVTIAVFYLILGGAFIAMAQVTVYAGAIMVLFLFVIMLLGAEQLGGGPTLGWQRPLAIVLGIALLVETAFIFTTRTDLLPELPVPLADFGSPAAIGEVLFNRYLLPFEVTSVLLLIAMIGALVLTRNLKN
jgi:NADH-quinone oxidoreductase subunit J